MDDDGVDVGKRIPIRVKVTSRRAHDYRSDRRSAEV